MRLYQNNRRFRWQVQCIAILVYASMWLYIGVQYDKATGQSESRNVGGCDGRGTAVSDCNDIPEADRTKDKGYKARVQPADSYYTPIGNRGRYRQQETDTDKDEKSIGVVVDATITLWANRPESEYIMSAEKVTVELKEGITLHKGHAIIVGTINKDLPLSSTGKSHCVVSMQGISNCALDGKPIRQNVNLTIKNEEYRDPNKS